MTESVIGKEERMALRMWFRQAIAQLEKEEVSAQFIRNREFYEGSDDTHRVPVFRRRARRSRTTTHAKELVV
ncbi:MAG TPA: hypothetical protein V6D17_05435 [Candidatus Obscuribacterales bacterium]